MTDSAYRALSRTPDHSGLQVIPGRLTGRPAVVVAPLYVGICGTDLQILNGTRPDSASVLGHEASAIVVRVSTPPTASSLEIGQLVVVNPVSTDDQGGVTGIVGHDRPGMLQQLVGINAADAARVIVPVPQELPPPVATLIEPLAVCIYAYDTVAEGAGSNSTVVVGAGPIGVLMAWLLGQYGSTRIVVVDRDESRQRFLTRWPHLPRIASVLPVASLADLRSQDIGRFDSIYFCADLRRAGSVLGTVLPLLTPGGQIDFIARPPASSRVEQPAIYEAALATRMRNISGNRHDIILCPRPGSSAPVRISSHRGASSHHMRVATALAAANAPGLAQLITHIMDIDEAAEVLPRIAREDTAQTAGGVRMKALVSMAAGDHGRERVLAWS